MGAESPCLPEGARRRLGQQRVAVEHNWEDEGEGAEVCHEQRHEQDVADDALLVVAPPANAQQHPPVEGFAHRVGVRLATVLLSVLPQLHAEDRR